MLAASKQATSVPCRFLSRDRVGGDPGKDVNRYADA